jgi:phosphonate transport system substrate-binding protein
VAAGTLSRLRIGFIPIAGDPGGPDELAAEIGRALRLPTDVHRAADYRSLVAALERGVVQLAWVPPLIAAQAVLRGDVVPIALSVRNGTTSYSAALITHVDSPLRDPSELRGAKAAWVDRESASGYTIIRMALRARGIALVDAFGEELFVRSHAEVARLVHRREADVGATYFSSVHDGGPISRAGWLRVDDVPEDGIRVIAEAGPIPSDFFAAHAGVPQAVLDGLRAALLDGHPEPVAPLARRLLRNDGFLPPTREHTAMLRALVASLSSPRS